jgi:hypothetical protein
MGGLAPDVAIAASEEAKSNRTFSETDKESALGGKQTLGRRLLACEGSLVTAKAHCVQSCLDPVGIFFTPQPMQDAHTLIQFERCFFRFGWEGCERRGPRRICVGFVSKRILSVT